MHYLFANDEWNNGRYIILDKQEGNYYTIGQLIWKL